MGKGSSHSKKGTLQLQVRDNGIALNLDEAINQIGTGLQRIGNVYGSLAAECEWKLGSGTAQ